MYTYLIQGFVSLAPISPLDVHATGRLAGRSAGWLHRKGNSLCQTADGRLHVLTMHKRTQQNKKLFMKSLTQIV